MDRKKGQLLGGREYRETRYDGSGREFTPKPTRNPKPHRQGAAAGAASLPPQAGRPSQLTVAEEALLVQHGHGIDDEERGLQQRVERERHGPAERSGAAPGAAPGAGAGAAPERDVAGLGAEPPLTGREGAGPHPALGAWLNGGVEYPMLRMEEAWLYGAG